MLRTQDDESPRMEKQGPLQERGVRGRAASRPEGPLGSSSAEPCFPGRHAGGLVWDAARTSRAGGWLLAGFEASVSPPSREAQGPPEVPIRSSAAVGADTYMALGEGVPAARGDAETPGDGAQVVRGPA